MIDGREQRGKVVKWGWGRWEGWGSVGNGCRGRWEKVGGKAVKEAS